jgi:hypothetical protein
VFTDAHQSRVGLWFNPALGGATFTAFDSTGSALESMQATAGNFNASIGQPPTSHSSRSSAARTASPWTI